MREVEFRAWDVEAKCYIKDPILVDNCGNVYAVYEEPSPVQGTCLITGKPNVILEQYISLKDKNGKEIYEGDIVEQTWFNGDDGDITIIGVIGFDKEEASFGIVETIQRTNKQYSGFYSQKEVIGNIHENPKLIKEER